ncbi:hypothetical protein FSARC_2489 [Fusarium sarcochroum]|uniref:NAD(P)-binding domain-containing protein n=1 Tax=Fusarium sarcochroum TaxID=1208366 RepID=A0A8H4U602_9HYPO|nr:hypothetical protein FSARC_2489 [Fusarium sarcochroum]
MHILLLGASDHNSSQILQSALSRNYTVTVLVRHELGTSYHPNLTLVTGSPTSQHDLEAALQTPTPPEAVIVALGHDDVLESITQALLNAIKGVQFRNQSKGFVSSPQGVKASCLSMPLPFRLVFSPTDAMRIGPDDHTRVDSIVRESGLPFALARPPRLIREPRKSVRASPGDGRSAAWLAAVTRASWLVHSPRKQVQ